MQQLAHDEAVLENGCHFRHRHRRGHQRPEHRKAAALGLEDDFAEHAKTAGDQNARHFVVLAHLAHRVDAIGGVQALEVANLAVAEHQHAPLAKVLVKPCEGEAGLLRVGTQDPAIEAAAAGENFEIEAQRFRAALEQFADCHAGCAHARMRDRGAAERFRSCHLPFTVSACCSTFLTAAVSDVLHAAVVPTPVRM